MRKIRIQAATQGSGKVWLIGIFVLGLWFGSCRTYSWAREVSDRDSAALFGAAEILKGMTLEEKIGQLFMLDFRKKDGRDVTAVDRDIAATINKYQPGGVILFRENTVRTLQTLKLTSDYQKASPKIPLFIAVDQEGGAVTRLQSATVMPGNMALGAAGDPKLAYIVAKATGEELKNLGINMNFAPVVDVNNNPANPVIGIRSFGDNPGKVAALGVQFMKGLHDAGIIAAAKHFPGHGDTSVDSHIALPTVAYGLDRLEKMELLPFKAMIRNGADMIMTAHVTFPAIDDREGVPATLSNKCLTGLLRERLGFDQVIITDAFSMKAITDRFGDKEAALMAIEAGADIVLMPQNLPDTFDYIREQVRDGAIPEARIDGSVKRILTLKIKRGIIGKGVKSGFWARYRALKTVGGKEHAFIRRTVAERSVTLIKNEADNLPFRLEANRRIVFFAPSQTGADRVKEALRSLAGGAGVKAVAIQGFNYDGQRSVTAAQQDAIGQSDFILLFTRTLKAADLSPDNSFMPGFAADLVKTANVTGKKLAAVSVRNPYDVRVLTAIKSQIAVYSDWDGGGVAAALKVIFGKINPVGRLPVSLPDSDGKVIFQAGHGLSYSIDKLAAVDQSEPFYSSLSELWDRGMLDDVGSFKADGTVDGRELAHLLQRMLLVSGGQSWETRLRGKNLSRYGMIGVFKKAAAIAGFEPAAVAGYFDSKRRRSIRATQAEMAEAAAGFLRLLETGKMKAGGADR